MSKHTNKNTHNRKINKLLLRLESKIKQIFEICICALCVCERILVRILYCTIIYNRITYYNIKFKVNNVPYINYDIFDLKMCILQFQYVHRMCRYLIIYRFSTLIYYEGTIGTKNSFRLNF